jgi:uncharacterized protein YciI
MYLMISKYSVPIEEVDKYRDDHLAFLDGLESRGLVATAGRQNPPEGGVVVLAVDSAERAFELMADDPYVKAGVAVYTATGFTPSRGALKDFPLA